MTDGGYDCLPLISCVYGIIWRKLALYSQSQILGTRPASPRSPKYEYNNTQYEVIGVEQPFTVFLHVKSSVVAVQTDFGDGVFRLDALALSVIATATWLGGWLAGWLAGSHTPVLYQNR